VSEPSLRASALCDARCALSVGELTKRVLFGTRDRIAGTVYGTIVAMGAITAGAGAEVDASQLAAIVFATVLVLWIAHVYAHSIGESVEHGRRLDRAEFVSVARRELAIPLAAVGPVAALLLGSFGLIRESRAVWLALTFGVVTLAIQGLRFARLEHERFWGTAFSVGVNVSLGLLIVALKIFVAH
jgi:hypothetical protein